MQRCLNIKTSQSDIIYNKNGNKEGMEKRMKIAVSDDSRVDRGALRTLLKTCGQDFEIREYDSGAALCGDMGFIRECGIVFLDINMDGADGLETCGISRRSAVMSWF